MEAVAAVPPAGDQLYVKGGVPPDATTVAVPSVPLQLVAVEEVERVMGTAVLMVYVSVTVQFRESVIVTVKVPPVRFVCELVLVPSFHRKVNTLPVPPVGESVMEPPLGVQPFGITTALDTIAGGPPTGTVTTLLQRVESVTVTV